MRVSLAASALTSRVDETAVGESLIFDGDSDIGRFRSAVPIPHFGKAMIGLLRVLPVHASPHDVVGRFGFY